MINSLEIKDTSRSAAFWWQKVEQLKGLDRITFKSGLNVIVGPNGSGKSTILKCLARQLHCEQLGYQIITQQSVQNLVFTWPEDGWRNGVIAEHDGSPVFYFTPNAMPGVIGDRFDEDADNDDFRLALSIKQLSSGQQTSALLNRLLKKIEKCHNDNWEVPGMTLHNVNDIWKGWIESMRCFLKGTSCETAKPTVIFDEPTRSLDIANQIVFWNDIIPKLVKNTQVIIASLSPLALFAEGKYAIETVPGYTEKCTNEIKTFIKNN